MQLLNEFVQYERKICMKTKEKICMKTKEKICMKTKATIDESPE